MAHMAIFALFCIEHAMFPTMGRRLPPQRLQMSNRWSTDETSVDLKWPPVDCD